MPPGPLDVDRAKRDDTVYRCGLVHSNGGIVNDDETGRLEAMVKLHDAIRQDAAGSAGKIVEDAAKVAAAAVVTDGDAAAEVVHTAAADAAAVIAHAATARLAELAAIVTAAAKAAAAAVVANRDAAADKVRAAAAKAAASVFAAAAEVSAKAATAIFEGILPICGFCKKIRRPDGTSQQLESCISANSEARFSHGLCQECLQQHYPDGSV